MSVLSLGAINKITGEYVYPKIANKKDEYICPDCNKELILCQGKIKVHHFRHKVDTINPCHHYSKPTESQIHKDAKMLLKNLLERKITISFIRKCCCCEKNEEFEIPEMSESSVIELEHRFEYNGLKIADVAYIDNGELLCIFEICNTHKTSSENRPDNINWFEINAETLIKLANDNSSSSLQIPCIRCEKCEDCIDKFKNNKKEIKKMLNEKEIKKICNKINEKKFSDLKHHKMYNKWYAGYNKQSNLEYYIKCETYIDNILDNFEKNVFIKKGVKYDELYYNKYYNAIKCIKKYGEEWNGTERANWGGWGGNII
jgi:hypothetical protein